MSKLERKNEMAGQDWTRGENVTDLCQTMTIESVENSTGLSSLVIPQPVSQNQDLLKADSHPEALTKLPIFSAPVIIGNVHAASALSSVFHQEELASCTPKPAIPSPPLESPIPIFLATSNVMSVISPQPQTSLAAMTSEEKPVETTPTLALNHSNGLPLSKFDASSLEYPRPKPSLLSSDTIIITSESSNSTGAAKVSANETSLDMNDKALSLLSNISERSVSLESIPSFTLFRPDNMPETSSIGADGEESVRGVAVIGSEKVPPWLMEFMKKHKHLIIPNADLETQQNSKSAIVEVISNSQEKKGASNQSAESSLNLGMIQNVGSMDSNEESLVKTEGVLEHSDTVILAADEISLSKTTSDQPAAEQGSSLFEKMPSGFSFGSISTLSADPIELVEEQTLEGSLTSKQFSELSGAITDVLSGNISQVLYPVKITNDPLRFSVVAINDTNFTHARNLAPGYGEPNLSQSLGNAPVLMVCGSPSPRYAEAKETQTDLVLGNNTVYFKAVDTLSVGSHSATEHVATTVLPMTVASTASQCDPQVQVIQYSQPKPAANSQVPTSFISPTSAANFARTSAEVVASSIHISSPVEAVHASAFDDTGEPCLFKCVVCSEKFQTREAMVRHKKTHQSFKCDLCNATFTRMGNYTRHRKVHNLQAENQSGFRCDDCGRKFLQRCDLRRHCLIHTRQEPYRCDLCDKGYIRRSDLIVHMRFHNKDRAFHCSLCEKKFYQSGDLNRHMRRAHKPESELTCGHCDRKYACESTLIRHMKAVHKDIILQAVQQRFPEIDSSDKTSAVSSKDILFTMKQK